MSSQRILIVAGGTGGHLYPGIAIARSLRLRKTPDGSNWSVGFVVRRGDLGRDVLAREGFDVFELSGQGFPRTLDRRLVTFPFKFVAGWWQALTLLRRVQPSSVVGMGGYLSFPVLLSARALGIPTLIHEQNVVPGLANRLLRRFVRSVAVSFEDSLSRFKGANVWVSGLPVRSEIGTFEPGAARTSFGLSPETPTVLVFGGSLGAKRLNESALGAWSLLSKQRPFQVLHITGDKLFRDVERAYQALSVKAKVMPYCHSMGEAYAAASIVVCRSGASTVAELLRARRPAVLVPYPFASENHQWFNARVLEGQGAGKIILDHELNAERLAEAVRPYLAGSVPERSPLDGANAAESIATFITETLVRR